MPYIDDCIADEPSGIRACDLADNGSIPNRLQITKNVNHIILLNSISI